MPEVQKPILEHTTSEDCQEEVLTSPADRQTLSEPIATAKLKPLSVRITATGYVAEFDKEEIEKFLATDPKEYFYVDGVPVSASTSHLRELFA
jgi:hypothetical protein